MLGIKEKKMSRWKLLLIGSTLTAMLVVSGCSFGGSSNNQIEPDTTVTDSNQSGGSGDVSEGKGDGQELIKQLQSIAGTAEHAGSIIDYLNDNMANVDSAAADELLRVLHTYYKEHLEAVQSEYFAENMQEALISEQWPITEETAESIKDEAARKLVKESFAGGYKLETVEGSIFPVVDYGAQKRYSSHLSEQMNAFVELKALESEKLTAKDGAIILSWDELAERALMAEAYLKQHKSAPEWEAVKSLYIDRYLAMYINGLFNTPVHDFASLKLQDEVKASYETTKKKAADSVTGQLVSAFLDVMEGTNGQVVEQQSDGSQSDLPAVRQFRESLAAEAEKLLQ